MTSPAFHELQVSGTTSRCPGKLVWAPRGGHLSERGLGTSLLLLSPDTSHCAQRHGPHGQDGPRTGWLCWSGTWATSQKSTRWAGEWCLPVPSVWGPRGWQAWADHCCPLRTKIFIRFPKTLFATEDALEVRRQSLGEREAPPFPSQWGLFWGAERNHRIWAFSPGRPPHPHSAPLLTSSSPAPGCKLSARSRIPLPPPSLLHYSPFAYLPSRSAAPWATPSLMPLRELWQCQAPSWFPWALAN